MRSPSTPPWTDFARGRAFDSTDEIDKTATLHFLGAYNAAAGLHWSGKTPEQFARQLRAYATLSGHPTTVSSCPVIFDVPGWVDYGLWSPCALPARDLPLRI